MVIWIRDRITYEEALYIDNWGSKEIWRVTENSVEMVDPGVRSE